jgi:hypothetical protein
MKLLAQKSLKTELRLKRYGVLNLQGLDQKTVGVDFISNLKLRARSEFIKTIGGSV